MREVEIVVYLKRLRRNASGTAVLAGLVLVAVLAYQVPAVRTRLETAADRLAGWLVPTPPTRMAAIILPTPTPTFTPAWTPTWTPTPAPTPTPTPTPTPRPTPTPPPTPEPEAMGTPEVRIENAEGYIEVTVTVPPVLQTRYEYDARARQWYPYTTLVPSRIDMESVEWWIELPAETKVSDADIDLRTTDYRLQETFEGTQYRLVLTTTVEITGTYYIVFQARTQDGRLIQAIQEVTP